MTTERRIQHQQILAGRQAYDYEPASQKSYQRSHKDPRLVAFYLPQFHPIPENDRAWGKGFTEWDNVRSGQPQFIGHQQPFIPYNSNYYDLRDPQTLHDQIELAKQYGIYGFCFYYYWFSGKQLLEKPLNTVLEHTEWDFNFSICWANENWTKRWNGLDKEIIIEQRHHDDDALSFIKDVEHILLDQRYIHNNGKPVLLVYRAIDLHNPLHFTSVWRQYFRDTHGKELEIIAMLGFSGIDPRSYGFDKALDFTPLTLWMKSGAFSTNVLPRLDVKGFARQKTHTGEVFDYRAIALADRLDEQLDFPAYKSVIPGWDNVARRKERGDVFYNTSSDLYAHWLNRVVTTETQNQVAPLIFINAWNEWGEGAVLEPSEHQGYAILSRTAEVLSRHGHHAVNQSNFPLYGIPSTKTKHLAVVLLVDANVSPEQLTDQLAHTSLAVNQLCLVVQKKQKSQFQRAFPKAYVICRTELGGNVLAFLHAARRLDTLGFKQVLCLEINHENSVLQLLHKKSITSKIQQQLSGSTPSIVGVDKNLKILTQANEYASSLKIILEKNFGSDVANVVMNEPLGWKYFDALNFWTSLDSLRPITQQYYLVQDFAEDGVDKALLISLGLLFQLDGGRMYQLNEQGEVSKI